MLTEIEEQYLNWLYARIGSVTEKRKTKTYWSLFRYLYTQEFIWLIPNDNNRVEDGRYLRYEFLEYCDLSEQLTPDWTHVYCSVLEMIFGVSNRLAFIDDGEEHHWFWEILNNLNLSGYTDRNFDERQVEDIIGHLVWRTYAPDGVGGMFPRHNPLEDQRYVEIWYQMQFYIQDRH